MKKGSVPPQTYLLTMALLYPSILSFISNRCFFHMKSAVVRVEQSKPHLSVANIHISVFAFSPFASVRGVGSRKLLYLTAIVSKTRQR